jgi:hypothetical protein
MRPNDRNVSETLARIVEEQVVAATWRLELRVYLFLAAALMTSLAAPLFVLDQCFTRCRASWIVRNESCRAQVLRSPTAAAACPNTRLLHRHLHARGDALCQPAACPRPIWMRAQERDCSRGQIRPAQPVHPSTSRSAPWRALSAARATRRLRGGLRPAAPAVHHGHKHRTAL